jgi:hypothetical protein
MGVSDFAASTPEIHDCDNSARSRCIPVTCHHQQYIRPEQVVDENLVMQRILRSSDVSTSNHKLTVAGASLTNPSLETPTSIHCSVIFVLLFSYAGEETTSSDYRCGLWRQPSTALTPVRARKLMRLGERIGA